MSNLLELKKLVNNGQNLEVFTASFYQSLGFYVDSNLKWIEDKVGTSGKSDVLELDILAKKFNLDGIVTTLIECKRGCDFNDLFKFAGITSFLGTKKNILVCESHEIYELKKQGQKINIEVRSPHELINAIKDVTILRNLKLFFVPNNVSNKLFDKNIIKTILSSGYKFSHKEQKAYSAIRSYTSKLIGKVWRETNLGEQAILIKNILDVHKDFVREIARMLEIKPGNKHSEYYMSENPLCLAAGFLVMKIRVSYIICSVQCAIDLENGKEINFDEIKDRSFVKVVKLLQKNLDIAIKIPQFLQIFIYIFGGVISLIGEEIGIIARMLGATKLEISKIINLLKELYTLSSSRIQWGFIQDMGILYLKYVPTQLKGIGMINRKILNINISDFCFSDQWEKSLSNYNNN